MSTLPELAYDAQTHTVWNPKTGDQVAIDVDTQYGPALAAAPMLLTLVRMARFRIFGHGPSTDPLYKEMTACLKAAGLDSDRG